VQLPTGLLALSLRALLAQLAHALVVGGDAEIDAVVTRARPEVLRDLDSSTRATLLEDFRQLLGD
jgi:hypothetical protein